MHSKDFESHQQFVLQSGKTDTSVHLHATTKVASFPEERQFIDTYKHRHATIDATEIAESWLAAKRMFARRRKILD